MAIELGFVDPTAGGGKETIRPAPRSTSLSGKVVGLIDNTKEQADIVLHTIGEALCERYGVEDVIACRKEHYSKPATQEMIDDMVKQVDVAVAGLGG